MKRTLSIRISELTRTRLQNIADGKKMKLTTLIRYVLEYYSDIDTAEYKKHKIGEGGKR